MALTKSGCRRDLHLRHQHNNAPVPRRLSQHQPSNISASTGTGNDSRGSARRRLPARRSPRASLTRTIVAGGSTAMTIRGRQPKRIFDYHVLRHDRHPANQSRGDDHSQ
ncbi:MAG: hypothetical protein MZV64_05220 [Ignavibacteriales bacterium]|nr:hypothetical protein [Ignavibacteriales bacterium]